MAYPDAVLALSGLEGYWRLEETAGTTAADSSGKNRPLTYVNSPGLGQPSLLPADPDGRSVDFNGSSHYAWRPALPLGQLTLAAWGRLDALPSGGFAAKTIAGNVESYVLRIVSQNNVVRWGGFVRVGATYHVITGNEAPSVGALYFAAITYDGSAVRLFVNGAQQASIPVTGVPQSGVNFEIGREGGGNHWDGRIDEVAVWSRALTTEEIAALYEAGITPPPLVVSATSIPSEEAFGGALVKPSAAHVAPTGIASRLELGTPTVTPGPVNVLPTGVASGEAFGQPAVRGDAVVVAPAGIASGEKFGVPVVAPRPVVVAPQPVPSGEAFGEAKVSPAPVVVEPQGVPSAAAVGAPTVRPAPVVVEAEPILSAEAFGAPAVLVGRVVVIPDGIPSGEAFGLAGVAGGQVVSPTSIASGEQLGEPSVEAGPVDVFPLGVASGEKFGVPVFIVSGPQLIAAVGIPTGEAVGRPTIPGPVIAGRVDVEATEVGGVLTRRSSPTKLEVKHG